MSEQPQQLPAQDEAPTGLQAELAELRLPKPPFWMIAVGIVLVTVTWVPLAIIALGRVSKSTEPRVHIFQDMDVQPRYGPQASSDVFADGRAMRQPVSGTVARGELDEDDHYSRGFSTMRSAEGKWDVTYFEGLPAQVVADEDFIRRGQMQFNIYCALCHGKAGYGDGPVWRRVDELKEPWVQPTSIHSDVVRTRTEGHLFNTITNGIRNMPGYGHQISIKDRWAIVAYMRALQLSQNAPMDAVPADKRGTLR